MFLSSYIIYIFRNDYIFLPKPDINVDLKLNLWKSNIDDESCNYHLVYNDKFEWEVGINIIYYNS